MRHRHQASSGYVLDLSNFTQPIDQLQNIHAARVRIFADQGSWFHVGLGALTGFLPEPLNLAALTGWLGYEVSEGSSNEPWSDTGGKLIEFAIGLGIAAILRRVG